MNTLPINKMKQELDGMCFYEQPIFLIDTKEAPETQIIGYELLLRETDGKNIFPANSFKEYLKNNQLNGIFCEWLVEKVDKIVRRYPHRNYSFNLDPQQLTYESTYQSLEKLSSHNERLTVEITEEIPSQRNFDQYFDYSMLSQIKRLRALGYDVAIDDVSSGLNSFNIVRTYVKDINRIKLSLIQLCNMDFESIQAMILLWKSLAVKSQIELVIEGVYSAKISEWLLKNTLKMQQGYHFAMPEKIIVNN